METEDIIIFKDRITTRSKIEIKDDTGAISEVTLVEEKNLEETNTEWTSVDIIQTMTKKTIFQRYVNQNAETTINTGIAEGNIETTAFS